METTETSHPLSSSDQSDSDKDVACENASDIEQSTPMETNHTDQINNKGDMIVMDIK